MLLKERELKCLKKVNNYNKQKMKRNYLPSIMSKRIVKLSSKFRFLLLYKILNAKTIFLNEMQRIFLCRSSRAYFVRRNACSACLLVEEEDDGGVAEPLVVADRIEQL